MCSPLWLLVLTKSWHSSILGLSASLSASGQSLTSWSFLLPLPFTPFFMCHSSRRPWVLTKLLRSCCHRHLFAGGFLRRFFSVEQSSRALHLSAKVWSSGLTCLLLCLPEKIWTIFGSSFLAPLSGGIQARKREGMSVFLLMGRCRISF